MEHRLREIERRIARAERQARLMGAVAVCAVALLVTVAAARPARSQGAGNTVTAPFVVVDAAGQPLLRVAPGDYGAELGFYNRSGRRVGWLRAGERGGTMGVANNNESGVAWLDTDQDGGNVSVAKHASDHVVGWLTTYQDGGNLFLQDNAGERVGTLGTNTRGGMVALADHGGRVLFRQPSDSGRARARAKAVPKKPLPR